MDGFLGYFLFLKVLYFSVKTRHIRRNSLKLSGIKIRLIQFKFKHSRRRSNRKTVEKKTLRQAEHEIRV